MAKKTRRATTTAVVLRQLGARERGHRDHSVVFYRRTKFCCKTLQFCATRREFGRPETPSARVRVNGAKARKSSFLNYKGERQAYTETTLYFSARGGTPCFISS